MPFFFVSVGMLINAQVLVDYAVPILAITAVTIIGKLITTTAGSLLSGQSLRHSIQAGMSLAQIGEFSFIIAGLGLSLKVTSDFLYPIAISVSAITTFTTPYLIRSSDPLVYFIERKLPKKWRIKFESFRTASASVSQTSDWKILLKKSLMKIITNAVAVVALFLLVSEFLHPWLITQEWNPQLTEGVSLAIAFVLSAPILWAIVGGQFGGEAASALWSERRFTGPLFIFEMFRWIFATFLVTVLAIRIVAPSFILVAICILVIATVYWIPRYFEQIYEWLESWFVINFNEKETHSNKKSLPPLAPWDSHLAELTVSSDSSLIGRKLSELTIREKFGVTIALIERGKKVIPAPGRNDMLYPADVLQVIGSDEQINAFRYECEASAVALSEPPDFVYGLRSVYIDTTSPYVNKTIRDCGLREQTHGLVVGIEQNGKRILNPDSATIIHTGNVLWVVGDKKLMADI